MIKKEEFITIDKIKWWVWTSENESRGTQPYCFKHNIRMYPELIYGQKYPYQVNHLRCAECEKLYELPRTYDNEKQYVLDKVESKIIKGLKFINLDDEAIPIAEDKKKNSEYFVTSLLTESKLGLRLVVYAGKNGSNQKTQIFIEPGIKRLAFDQNNLHPTDIFTKLEATFQDGTKAGQKKK